MKTPINAETLRHHFTYSWWKYVLVLIAGIFLVNLIFTVTAPRIPEDKRVDFYVYGLSDSESLNAYMEKVRSEKMPDMQSMTSLTMFPNDAYGPMQLMTYMSAQEGDVFLLPRDEFLSYASSGAFLPLEDDEELMGIFNEAGIDLRRGWRTLSDSDETHLYGIPADVLPGLNALCYADNGFLTVTVYNGNQENVMKFLRILCRDMLIAPEAENEDPAA
jgi:hypothetical protein